jgi:SAM-dependent methyltransferase
MTETPRFRKIRSPDGYWTVEPLPDAAELRAFYAEVYYRDRPSASYRASYDPQELEFKRLTARQIVHALTVARNDAPAGRLLEIGCGEGFALAAADEAGWEATGVELSPDALRAFHPHLETKLIVADADDAVAALAADGRRFDAVVLQNVLEHVREPRRLLTGLRRILADGAAVSATLPNDESPAQRLLRDSGRVAEDYWFIPPQHLHYFDAAAGRAFAAACGFDVLDVYSDFPIEYFLFHPGSNFVDDRGRGPAAHRARIEITALLAAAGMPAFHRLARAQADCGVGRTFTMVLKDAAGGKAR